MIFSQRKLNILQLMMIINLIKQIASNSDCRYLSSTTILSLNNPQQQIDTQLTEQVYTGKENIGYGFWMKYQPFSPIATTTSNQSGGSYNSNIQSAGNFIYLLQQKETQINMVIVYTSISSQTSTIMHNIYYSFKASVSTISFAFDPLQYEGRWILFYMFINFLEGKTYFGFHYQLASNPYFELKTINDLPSIGQQIRHQIGGIKEITLNQQILSLSQFKGRLSSIFGQATNNILLDIEMFLSYCYVDNNCEFEEKDLTGYNLLMIPDKFIKNSTTQIEQQIYVLKGWVKLAQLENVYSKETLIFRISLIEQYCNDQNIGDKQLYLKYIQHFQPEQNGFILTTYSYQFPVTGIYQTSSSDTIIAMGAQFQDLFTYWHYIQFETGTNNNNGQPLFQIYFPSLTKILQYTWSKTIYYFSGVVLYFTIGGDSFTTENMEGYISDLILDVYCSSPEIIFTPKCHYSCLTCDGPTLSNCLSCPLNSNRIQSLAQKTCSCKNSYIDLENEPICIAANVQYPQMKEIEYELQCNKLGYNDCGESLECQYGYFIYNNSCIQCPGYSSYSTQSSFICSNCLFNPNEFSQSLLCNQDTQAYDSSNFYVYHSINRDESNIDIYQAQLNKDNIYELELQVGYQQSNICKNGYFKISNSCSTCLKGCKVCQNSYTCQVCYDGYSITKSFICQKCEGCLTCKLSETKIICTTCEQGMYLYQGSCRSCGKNCASCSSTGICYYCEDPQSYYLTFDGSNCAPCNIEKCQYCYEYYILNDVIYTTLDIGYVILDLYSVNFQVGCALCETNLYYNIITHICENNPSTTQNNEGIYGEQSNDCSFGLILDLNYNTHCLVSLTSSTSTQIKSCSTITNCKSCIQNYLSLATHCMLCADGYYAQILTGQCVQCSTTCRTCVQQNTLYNDYWKWSIKPFYKYILSQDDSHPFETYVTSISETDLQLICITCNKGYLLYQNQCIEDCDEACTVCEIIDGIATCVQCLETPYGFLRSKDAQGNCLICPNFCAACFDRTEDEISSYNPYFILTSSNIKYTRICYEKFNIIPADGNYFFDQLLRTITICSSFQKCYYKTIIKFNLYCSYYDYILNQNGEVDFFLKNNFIEAFFKDQSLKDVETQGFFTYLNNKGVRYLEFQYNVIQGSAFQCLIPESSVLFTKVQQNVFSIQSVQVSFIGSKSQTVLTISSDLDLNNFTTISFQKFIIDSSYQSSQYSQISLYNLKPSIQLEIMDCIFTSKNNQSIFYFYSLNPYSLTINNLVLSNYYLEQTQLFSLVANENLLSPKIKVNKLMILDCQFYKSVFLYLNSTKQNLDLDIQISDVFILNGYFNKSYFIKTASELTYTSGSFQIEIISLNKTILQESSFFLIGSALSLQISNVHIYFTNFVFKSQYLQSNIIRSTNILVQNCFLGNSLLFSNDIDYTNSPNALTNSALIELVNLQIEQLYYNDKSGIINFVGYDIIDNFTIHFSQIILKDCLLTSFSNSDYASYESSLIYIECQTCVITNFTIIRGGGYPELAIVNSKSIYINQMVLTQSPQYYSKTLHTSFDCVSKFTFTQQLYFLYIGQYENISINGLQIKDCIVYNNPIIIFKGYEYLKQTLSELIMITDSIFENNMLIISKQNSQTSILSFSTEQECSAVFENVKFIENHLNEYFQDLTRESTSTLFLSIQLGIVKIVNSLFHQNLATNTTDSIMYIKSSSLFIEKTIFEKNNILQISKLSKKILLSQDQFLIDSINFINAFPISSKSGNGLLVSTLVSLDQIIVKNSFAQFGGSFYINVQGQGILRINNSYFNNTQTSLTGTSFSKGGCLYIDAHLSKFNFTLSNSNFDTSFSRVEGGALYILPSKTSNYLYFHNLEIRNCFSITNSFLSFVISSSSTIQSNTEMVNLTFKQTTQGFEKFLSLTSDLTDSDFLSIQNSNPLIFIQHGNVSLKQITFQSMHMQYLFHLYEADNIIIEGINIEKSTILYSPLIKISFRQTSQSLFLVNRITIKDVKQLRDFNNNPATTLPYCQSNTTLTCPNNFSSLDFNLSDYNSDQYDEQQKMLNIFYIYTNETFNFSLIEIDNVNSSHSLLVENVIIDSVNCSSCEYGLIRVLNIFQSNVENLKFKSISITNSICGQKGCFAIVQSEAASVQATNLDSSYRLLQQLDYTNLAQKFTHQALIETSYFYNNQAKYGGAIYIIDIAILINNCRFEKNTAFIGGAIYFYSLKKRVEFFNSRIIQNTAAIGGGLYLNQQQLQKTDELDVKIIDNNSTLFGQDIIEQPRSLTISYDGCETKMSKKIFFSNDFSVTELIIANPYKILGFPNKTSHLMYPSGRAIGSYEYFDQYKSEYIPYNFTFRIIALNKFNTQEKKLSLNSTCTITPTIWNSMSETYVKEYQASLSQTKVNFNYITGDFNLDNLIIYFNPNYDNNIVLRLKIQCDMISIPQYDSVPPYLINSYITNYTLLVDIKTFPCQLGEFLNSTSGGCVLCDVNQNQYQVKKNAQSCSYKDDLKMQSIKSSMIQLRYYYWRAYYYSQTVEYCYHLRENCLGGWLPGDNSCIVGHIGALCEQCDLYNIRGDGSFSISSQYQCGSCDKIIGNVLSVLFISIWTLISILMSVSSTVKVLDQFMIGIRLKQFGVTAAIKQASTAILIKVFTNYLQIVSTISTFQLSVPSDLTSMVNSVGNPIQSMAYSLDCFLISLTEILIIYFRIIWSLLMATSYITVFLVLSASAIFFKQIKYNFSYISTALIYVFIYLQPNLISGLISLVSYRIISDQYWVQGNVAYLYDTSQHARWSITFCFPFLSFFAVVIPIILWYGVHKNKNRLDLTQTRQTWGYLYNEYKLSAYFWETIKILQKELIIIVLAYYEDHIPIKASLIFLVLFGYSFFTTKKKPYMTGELNYLDTQSTVVCAVSIILGSSIYTAQQSDLLEIVWPFYFIIAVLNAVFTIKMLIKILLAYFVKLNDQIDKIKDLIHSKFPDLVNYHPIIQQLLESKKQQQERVKRRFIKLRKYLIPQAQKILEFKKKCQPSRILFQASTSQISVSQINSKSSNLDTKIYLPVVKRKDFEISSLRQIDF